MRSRLPRQPARPPRERPLAANRRQLGNPSAVWHRRLERKLSQFFSHRVFPRVPGIHLAYARQLERGLTVSEAEVPILGLAAPFHGCTALLVTDLHAGPFLAPRDLERTMDRLMSLEPDLVLLGGDFTSTRVADLERTAAALRRLSAPLGVFAVLGNHDHYTGDPAGVRRGLTDLGIRVLHNQVDLLRRAGASLALAGVDDLAEGDYELEAVLAEVPPAVPSILLSHNPDLFFDAADLGVSLVLAGHTHGGQIRLPRLPVLIRQSRFGFHEGCFVANGCQLVVSRGLGVVGLPLRLGCPPEAVLLTLRSA